MRSARPFGALAAASLALVAVVAAPARAAVDDRTPPPPGKGQGAARPAGTQSRPATRPTRKVFTNADLERLAARGGGRLSVMGSPSAGVIPSVGAVQAVTPQEVMERYEELIQEADRRITELEREKLAGVNPFLRGLASASGGPRAAAEVEQELNYWRIRKNSAVANRDRAAEAAGVRLPPPPAEEPEPNGDGPE